MRDPAILLLCSVLPGLVWIRAALRKIAHRAACSFDMGGTPMPRGTGVPTVGPQETEMRRIAKAWRGWACVLAVGLVFPTTASAGERVILLHGLARTERSMEPMQRALEADGFSVANVGYPSRTRTISELSEEIIERALVDARREGVATVHFVTHSMGGILVRSYLSRHPVPELGRVVMLAPPSQGSEVVDAFGGLALFRFVNGPAGKELGTDAQSVPNQLGPVHYPVGVIAGNRSINWINSLLIPGEDDGKVSLERTKLAGMADHIVLPATHPFIMGDDAAIRQTIAFLRNGRFERDVASQ